MNKFNIKEEKQHMTDEVIKAHKNTKSYPEFVKACDDICKNYHRTTNKVDEIQRSHRPECHF